MFSALRARSIRVVVATTDSKTADDAYGGTATPWPTPSPAPTSPVVPGLPARLCLPSDAEPVLLSSMEVPALLAETTRWLPFVEGASWTYELTRSHNEAQWTRGQKRVQVEKRWRLAEDAMLVRLSEAITRTEASAGGCVAEGLEGWGSRKVNGWKNITALFQICPIRGAACMKNLFVFKIVPCKLPI